MNLPPSCWRALVFFPQFASLNLCGKSPALGEETFFWLGCKQMEEVFDIFQVCGPLLSFCWIVAEPPLPTWTRLEHYSRTPLFPLVFIYLFLILSLNSNPSSLTPLLKTAPHPLLPPLVSPSLAYCLSCSLDMRSSVWLAEGWETKRSGGDCLGTRDTPLPFFPIEEQTTTKRRGGGDDTGVSGSAFFSLANPHPPSRLLPVCLGVSADFSPWLPASAGWVRWLWDHYLQPGDLERYEYLLPDLLRLEPAEGKFTRRRSWNLNVCDRDTGGHLWTKTSNSIRD